MTNIKRLNELLKDKKVEKFLGFKVEIASLFKFGYYEPYGLRSEHGGVYYTGSYSKIINAANKILVDCKM